MPTLVWCPAGQAANSHFMPQGCMGEPESHTKTTPPRLVSCARAFGSYQNLATTTRRYSRARLPHGVAYAGVSRGELRCCGWLGGREPALDAAGAVNDSTKALANDDCVGFAPKRHSPRHDADLDLDGASGGGCNGKRQGCRQARTGGYCAGFETGRSRHTNHHHHHTPPRLTHRCAACARRALVWL